MGGARLDAARDAKDAQAGGAAPKGMQPLPSGERPFTNGAKRRPLILSDHQRGGFCNTPLYDYMKENFSRN